ncbi:PREDICTED: sister chromatid cohesion 1 protein 2-like isoform X1 [Brassica oleracea var. oleracea]|uniref:Rad21/Rec8-like protein N-terminal domain-containing protein n=1 Tax=Brassica oleracea var. oleracea TaxID=109376 RepID=A0A0D3CT55_BRAOL|nr:PREDICTED: sister chromatid cohesion 1 protein 2-like isoform X1 [Brassica oleracea var. oleracea]
MFHSEGLVSRKGPLGAIWVAAYFVKKLKKAQVKDTNIPSSVDQILQQELDALTYRGLAYLLLGLVRIYSKKVDSLFHDCNTALIGVKEQNRDNTNVPLPAAASTGFPSIALPQCFELDAFDLGLLEDSHGDNVKPQEDITLKHDGVSGRDTESIDHYYMERFDMEEDDLGCTFHVVDDHTDTRHDTAHDMDIDVRDASGEASVREVEAEPLESNKSSRDQQNASRHDRSLPSECKSPEALHGIEELEPGSVVGNGDLPECIEKHRGHSDVEMTDTNMFHTEPSETPQVNKVGYNEKGFLSDMTLSEEPESKGSNAKDAPVAATPKTPSRLKTSQGETSHQFSIINTPGGKESSSRVSRKRKCLIDDEVIIPNKVLKKMIEDSSTLVTKRRKVPHTDYYERRIKRFADPSRSFWDPLFPYGSLDLQLLFCQPIKFKEQNTTETPKAAKTARRMKRSSLRTVESRGDVFPLEQTETGREIMETPQAAGLAELKITVPEMVSASSIAAESAHQTKVAPETPMKPAEPTYIAPETPAVSERVEIAPDTPVRESMSKRYFEDPETCEQETRPSNSFTFFDECPSAFCEDRRDLDAILMNEEVNAHETEDLQQETWLARTRNVAKFLEKTFLEQREKGEEEKASLLQLCRGRTQKESARLFYETLVLKTKGYLEVKQDHPYSDILLSRFTGQHEAC